MTIKRAFNILFILLFILFKEAGGKYQGSCPVIQVNELSNISSVGTEGKRTIKDDKIIPLNRKLERNVLFLLKDLAKKIAEAKIKEKEEQKLKLKQEEAKIKLKQEEEIKMEKQAEEDVKSKEKEKENLLGKDQKLVKEDPKTVEKKTIKKDQKKEDQNPPKQKPFTIKVDPKEVKKEEKGLESLEIESIKPSVKGEYLKDRDTSVFDGNKGPDGIFKSFLKEKVPEDDEDEEDEADVYFSIFEKPKLANPKRKKYSAKISKNQQAGTSSPPGSPEPGYQADYDKTPQTNRKSKNANDKKLKRINLDKMTNREKKEKTSAPKKMMKKKNKESMRDKSESITEAINDIKFKDDIPDSDEIFDPSHTIEPPRSTVTINPITVIESSDSTPPPPPLEPELIQTNSGISTGPSSSKSYGGGSDDIVIEDTITINENIIDTKDNTETQDNISNNTETTDTHDNTVVDNVIIEDSNNKVKADTIVNDKTVPLVTINPVQPKINPPPAPAPAPSTNTKSSTTSAAASAAVTTIPSAPLQDLTDFNYIEAREAHLQNLQALESGLQSFLYYTALLVVLLIVAYSVYYVAVLRGIYRRKVADLRRRKRSMQAAMEEANENEIVVVVDDYGVEVE